MKIVAMLAMLLTPVLALAQTTQPVTETANGDEATLRTPTAMSMGELLRAAQQAFEAKEYFTAKAYAEEILRREESNVEALLIDAKIAEEERDVNRVRERYLAVRQVQPNEFEANYGLGKIYVRKKIYRQATFYLESAIAVAPPEKASEVFVQYALAKRGMSKLSEALEAAIQAVQLDRESLEAVQLLVTLQTEANNFEQAILAGQALVQLSTSKAKEESGNVEGVQRVYAAYESLRRAYAKYLVRLYQAESSGTVTDQLVPGNEHDAAVVLSRIVDIELLQTELRVKLSHFDILTRAERAVGYDSTSIPALMQFGLLLKSTSQFDKARRAFERVLELKPDQAEALRQLSTFGPGGATSQPSDALELTPPLVPPVELPTASQSAE